MTHLYSLKQEMTNSDIFLCFNGPISQALLVELGENLRAKMSQENASKLDIIRVFSLLVETGQNIIHYSAEKFVRTDVNGNKQKISVGIISVGYTNEHYFLSAGNLVQNEKIEFLEKQINFLNSLDARQLKEHYQYMRRKNHFNGNPGAGLGFIEMARRTRFPIHRNYHKVDSQHSFFTIRLTV